ncbi:porin family protein [candidate division KSB1 bacterium]
MKTTVITLVLLVLLSVPADAQVNFGAKGGISYSAFQNENTEFVTGHSAGLFVDKYENENWIISLEVNHLLRGGIIREVISRPIIDIPFDPNVYATDLYVKNWYLEIPILIKYKSNIKKGFELYPYCGISGSFPLTGGENTKNEHHNRRPITIKGPEDYDAYDVEDHTSPNADIGIIVGQMIGYKYLIFDLRLYLGLYKVGYPNWKDHIKSRQFSLTTSIGFRL